MTAVHSAIKQCDNPQKQGQATLNGGTKKSSVVSTHCVWLLKHHCGVKWIEQPRVEQAQSAGLPRLGWYLCPYVYSVCQSQLLYRLSAAYASVPLLSMLHAPQVHVEMACCRMA